MKGRVRLRLEGEERPRRQFSPFFHLLRKLGTLLSVPWCARNESRTALDLILLL